MIVRRKLRVYLMWVGIFAFLAILYAWENEWVRSYQNPMLLVVAPTKYVPAVAEEDLLVSDIPFSEDDEREDLLRPSKRLSICVVSSNPRTASVFSLNLFRRIGNGKFDYRVVSSPAKCEANTLVPQLRMVFQKTLSLSELNKLTSHNALVVVMGDEFCRCSEEFCANPDLVCCF
jgi:hypothetical protein